MAGAVVFLLSRASLDQTSRSFEPSTLLAAKLVDGARVRVVGKVAEGIKYELAPRIELSFEITDPANGVQRIPVIYHNIKPDMFNVGRIVILDGRWQSGLLEATTLLTQCPSKYEPPSAPNLQSDVGGRL